MKTPQCVPRALTSDIAAGLGDGRFILYDGRRIPLPDGCVDLVFSQQVLEHVMDDVIEAYYAEEGRVLKPGGLALHQVPHRLVPFDSHTGTWFVHYLPRVLRLRLYCWLGHDPDYVERLLCLRWPEFHRVRMIEHVGSYQDLTLRRLVEIRDFGNDGPVYDGSLALRRMIGAAIDMPVIGRLAGAILRRLVMIESLSVKRS